ncbi:hypothetical protein KbCgl_16980 [Corynebacterium glutamicum]|nr:hypothetical protein KbCgl_16980 [Corynebacterium glutamicum]
MWKERFGGLKPDSERALFQVGWGNKPKPTPPIQALVSNAHFQTSNKVSLQTKDAPKKGPLGLIFTVAVRVES